MKYISKIVFLLILVACNNMAKEPWELVPGIYILDKQGPVKSVKELATILYGKGVYIDRWATWCSPCLDEFEFKDSLKKFLDSRSMVLVYLNSDVNIEEDALFEFIKTHDLKGFHLRLNNDLKADLTDEGLFVPLIPQYMIMSSWGEIVENRALRPSDSEKLYAQVEELLRE